MHIVDIKLENIKSHRDSTFHFERGTTAIVGENGAGKTTIIEAIAWTLFDLLDYKKDIFVRRGAKKGSVTVTFESTKDERSYSVYRDTGTGYNIFDPELGVKIADKKDEVMSFLRLHLGVEPNTDLELLFRSAIGVPQGTLTAIFLDTSVRRKDTFDKLLKVEEYRQSADKLLATTRYVETQLNEVEKKIARAEGELSRLSKVESEQAENETLLTELNANRDELKTEETQKRANLQAFEKQEAQVKEIQAELDKLRTARTTSEVLLAQKQGQADDARQAGEKLKSVEEAHTLHLSVLAELKGLDTQRVERDRLANELKILETAIVRIEGEQKNLNDSLEKAVKAQQEISGLSSLIRRQGDVEKRREVLRNEQARAQVFIDQAVVIEGRIETLRNDFTKTKTELKEAEEKSKIAAEFETLSEQETEINRRIASLQARLESDERFQREIRNGLCPILSQRCLNIAEGQTLEAFIESQFDEIRAEIKEAEKRQAELSVSLKEARDAAQFARSVETLQRRQEEITELGKKLREDKDAADKYAKDQPAIKKELSEIEKSLTGMRNPRERVQILTREAETAVTLKARLSEIEKELASLAEKRSAVSGDLVTFVSLDEKWQTLSGERDRTADAHREYLANEMLAKTLTEREAELKKLSAQDEKLKQEFALAESRLNEAAGNYDAGKHHVLKEALLTIEKNLADLNTRISIAQKRQEELQKELARLREILVSMQAEFKEKERLEKVGEATRFIRDTLKEAAPRVARNYVYHVSNEANQLFREITGNPERSLKWSEDYAVILEESGYERPFQSMSGGEQMAAALSIRLALLKQLSDVRMAFFDEPTTNMDAVRRQNLAEHISHITEKDTFDQLFVISHDDTFEEYVDNVVTVGGESSADGPSALSLTSV